MSRDSSSAGAEAVVSIGLLLVIGFFSCIAISAGGCEDKPKAATVLDNEGYTEVTFTGYKWGACADSDNYHTGFRAKNREGKVVEGVVCCGAFLKSCTIRY